MKEINPAKADAGKQHTEPCVTCPWKRGALCEGEMGAELLRDIAHGEIHLACNEQHKAQCAGLAIYRGNVCKLPRDRAALRLPVDRVKVFATPQEFMDHHARTKDKGRRAAVKLTKMRS